MKVRFLADADLNKAIVSGSLRHEPSLDFLTAQAVGLHRITDLEVLALAAEQLPAHFRTFRNEGRLSSGVFLVPQRLASNGYCVVV